MELDSEKMIALNRSRKHPTVFTGRHGLLHRRYAIGMSKVNEAFAGKVAQQSRFARKLQLVPAHVRRFYVRREVDALTRKNTQACDVGRFGAGSKHPLHPKANS